MIIDRLLSHDLPRSRWLARRWSLIVRRRWRSRRSCSPAPRRWAWRPRCWSSSLLVASYDLLLGYTGIVSFAHTMFFGIGAYGVAIASDAAGRRAGARSASGWRRRCVLSLVLSLVIGLFSLRVKAIFFAMITLAVAAAFQTLASQLSDVHRRRGRPELPTPAWLSPCVRALRRAACSAC